jgi:hypothetical protein
MPGKTDRILSYLPGTFRAADRQSALRAFVDAFGSELLKAENSLSQVMQSHWVDHADKNAAAIDDLACLAALFGLVPREDESPEEFREHLKRYVRTSLEGTVTVKGMLKVTAEALGLHISDSLDFWWNREEEDLVTIETMRDDAAQAVFAMKSAACYGLPKMPALITGKVDTMLGLDLTASPMLYLRIDEDRPVQIDLAEKAKNRSQVMPEEIWNAIEEKLKGVASVDGRYITLSSRRAGPFGRLEIMDGKGDASELIFGLAPRTYRGSQGLPAMVTGRADLSRGIDLGDERYLLLVIDGKKMDVIDCAGKEGGIRSIDEICTVINDAAGKIFNTKVAFCSGQFITLISPGNGSESKIELAIPSTGGDAVPAIFGIKSRIFQGMDESRALISGRDSSAGIDLRALRYLKIAVDGGQPVMVDLWSIPGELKSAKPADLAGAINNALKGNIARVEGGRLIMESATMGGSGSLILEPVEEARHRRFVTRAAIIDEAALPVFGFISREARGAEAESARLVGKADLSRGVDLRGSSLLLLEIDRYGKLEIGCAGKRPRATLIQEVVDAINRQTEKIFKTKVASHDGAHLILVSPSRGSSSRIAFPLDNKENAWEALFGSVDDATTGNNAQPAVIIGDADISGMVDLSKRGIIRLSFDGRRPIDIDLSGACPQQTFADEIVSSINRAIGEDVATLTKDGRLQIASATTGIESRLSLLPLRFLEVIEYPARTIENKYSEKKMSSLLFPYFKGGNDWSARNDGVADVFGEVIIKAPLGAVNPGIWNRTSGRQIRLLTALQPGESARIWREPGEGLRAEVACGDGKSRTLEAGEIFTGPAGLPEDTPFDMDQSREAALIVPRGGSDWHYLDSLGMRFDQCGFNECCFAALPGVDRTIFNLSRFAAITGREMNSVLPVAKLASPKMQQGQVELTFSYSVHRPGSFEVNLPADLPVRFGGRLGEMRLGQGEKEGPEVYPESVTEPEDDPACLVSRINIASSLVKAEVVSRVPLGWEAKTLPLRKPVFLTLGRKDRASRLYLKEKGQKGFTAITARREGIWGNEIAVTAQPAGPAMYDVSIIFKGDKFECARKIVLGGEEGARMQPCKKGRQKPAEKAAPAEGMPALMRELLKPGTIGILQTKAAGIRADVTRDGT